MAKRTLLLFLIALGCGDDDRMSADVTIDSESDATSDVPVDASISTGCRETHFAGSRVLAEEGVDGEANIHPSLAYDGGKLWLSFANREENTSVFDVRLREIDCDGTLGSVIRVVEGDGANDLDGSVAVARERVLVVYQSQVEGGNVGAFGRLFDLHGAPQGETLELGLGRQATTVWMPQASTMGDDFMVLGTWGIEEINGFRAFSQTISTTGEVSMAMDADDNQDTQGEPSLSGNVVALTELFGDSDASRVVAGPVGSIAPVSSDDVQASAPSVSGDFVTWVERGNAFARRVHHLPSGMSTTITGTTNAGGPMAIAARGENFALIWTSTRGNGLESNVYWASGTWDGTALQVTGATQIQTEEAAFPYPPAIINVDDGLFFAAWVEGEGGRDFNVFGRFLELE